jgi:hypothetical protein
MTTTIAPAPATIRALPYVDGESRRFKASPTKLTLCVPRITSASKRGEVRQEPVRI